MWVRKASRASSPGRSRPSMWSTVWIRRLYISICRRPITRTLRHADPRLVVAVHVGAHGQLRLILDRVEQGTDVGGVLQRVGTTPDRAGDRAGLHPVPGHPHIHLGRRADQALPLPEVEEELVWR